MDLIGSIFILVTVSVLVTFSFALYQYNAGSLHIQRSLSEHVFRSPLAKAVLTTVLARSLSAEVVVWTGICFPVVVFEWILPSSHRPYSWDGCVAFVAYMNCALFMQCVHLRVFPNDPQWRLGSQVLFSFMLGCYRVYHAFHVQAVTFSAVVLHTCLPVFPCIVLLGYLTSAPALWMARVFRTQWADNDFWYVFCFCWNGVFFSYENFFYRFFSLTRSIVRRVFAQCVVNGLLTMVGIYWGQTVGAVLVCFCVLFSLPQDMFQFFFHAKRIYRIVCFQPQKAEEANGQRILFDLCVFVFSALLAMVVYGALHWLYVQYTPAYNINPFVDWVLDTFFNPIEHDGETQAKIWG